MSGVPRLSRPPRPIPPSLFKGNPLEVPPVSSDRPEQREAALETIFYRAERVPLVYWGRFSGAKATVGFVAVIAIVAFISGLSLMSQETISLEGPLAAYLPEVDSVIRFGGVLVSFALIATVFGLKRRKRLAWIVAMILLPATALIPLLTLESTHVPLLVMIAVSVPLLLINRNQFQESLDLTPLQIASLASIVGVLAYGTIGAFAIRDQFVDIETWSDALYFVLVTIATVGYGDMTPVTTEAKWFSLSVIVFGVGAFTTAIGALIVPAIEKRMATAFGNMTPSTLALLEDHIIILGYSEITDAVIEEIDDSADVVVITTDADVASDLDEAEVNVLTADPTNVETLRNAKAELARGVVAATDDDARDVLAILATREVNPDVKIVAAASEAHNVKKLQTVGADHVVSPSTIGGRLLGRAILGEDETAELLDVFRMGPSRADADGADEPSE